MFDRQEGRDTSHVSSLNCINYGVITALQRGAPALCCLLSTTQIQV